MTVIPHSMGGIVHPNYQNSWSFAPSPLGPSVSMNWSQGVGAGMPQMHFLVFDGSNPKLWISRCEKYFVFYSIPSEIVDQAGRNSQSMEVEVRDVNWNGLCLVLNTRFGRDHHTILIRQLYHIR